jgi:hypothetical protein
MTIVSNNNTASDLRWPGWGFKEVVLASWPERGDKIVQDHWRDVKAATRKFCKGWGANVNSQMKKDKKDLLSKLE